MSLSIWRKDNCVILKLDGREILETSETKMMSSVILSNLEEVIVT